VKREGPTGRSPGSAAHLIAPPIEIETGAQRVRGRFTFDEAYEGPPGFVHGGTIAAAFDVLLGAANAHLGAPGMTARLTVRYRRPTPLHREVRMEAWHERRAGRRGDVHGTMSVDGEVTAEAEGLFVTVDRRLVDKYFSQ